MVERAASTNTPLAQAALRLVSAVLRERPHAIIKQSHFETQIAFFLDRIKPDLQEPARQVGRDSQVAAFNFLKAVLGRVCDNRRGLQRHGYGPRSHDNK